MYFLRVSLCLAAFFTLWGLGAVERLDGYTSGSLIQAVLQLSLQRGTMRISYRTFVLFVEVLHSKCAMRASSPRCCSQRSQRLCGHRWMAYGFVSTASVNVRTALRRGSSIAVNHFRAPRYPAMSRPLHPLSTTTSLSSLLRVGLCSM